MSHKRDSLQKVESVASGYKRIQERLDEERKGLLLSIWEAKKAGATQMEIANKTHFSRQRIAQFLKEMEPEEQEEDDLAAIPSTWPGRHKKLSYDQLVGRDSQSF